MNRPVERGSELRGAREPDDRQVLATFGERNLKVDSDPWASANQDAWGGAIWRRESTGRREATVRRTS